MQNEKRKIGKKNLTREEVIKAVKRAAREAGGVISKREFFRRTGIREHTVFKLFPEAGWVGLQRMAGVRHHPAYHPRTSDKELLSEYHRVASSIRRIPTWPVFVSRSKFSDNLFRRRFGNVRGFLREYLEYLKKRYPGSPLVGKVKSRLEAREHILRNFPARMNGAALEERLPGQRVWDTGKRGEYGGAIDFRSLHYAPTNERCLIFLFGVVSWELGFLVETIRTAYPDCVAKRRVAPRSGEERWESVRIEFEYKSSNFQKHRHDPAECDIVVCWKNDWQGCPIEVIELRKVIEEMAGGFFQSGAVYRCGR